MNGEEIFFLLSNTGEEIATMISRPTKFDWCFCPGDIDDLNLKLKEFRNRYEKQ